MLVTSSFFCIPANSVAAVSCPPPDRKRSAGAAAPQRHFSIPLCVCGTAERDREREKKREREARRRGSCSRAHRRSCSLCGAVGQGGQITTGYIVVRVAVSVTVRQYAVYYGPAPFPSAIVRPLVVSNGRHGPPAIRPLPLPARERGHMDAHL